MLSVVRYTLLRINDRHDFTGRAPRAAVNDSLGATTLRGLSLSDAAASPQKDGGVAPLSDSLDHAPRDDAERLRATVLPPVHSIEVPHA